MWHRLGRCCGGAGRGGCDGIAIGVSRRSRGRLGLAHVVIGENFVRLGGVLFCLARAASGVRDGVAGVLAREMRTGSLAVASSANVTSFELS